MIHTITGTFGTAIIYSPRLDEKAAQQIQELTDSVLAKDAHIRIMPDYHAGAGCVIGTTMRIGNKVCPNLVGVDINCGLTAVNIGNQVPPLAEFDSYLRKNIPSGFNTHRKPALDKEQIDFWTEQLLSMKMSIDAKTMDTALKSLGTLGGGNHFIELGRSKNSKDYWLVVHSGSRGIGNTTASYHQDLAQCKNRGDVPKALSYLMNSDLKDYQHDLAVMTGYANENRKQILTIILQQCFANPRGIADLETITTVHNNITDGILHKGAVLAPKGHRFLVPMNMADGILLCKGRGNPDWNSCAPHGAGRLYSRTKAKRELCMTEFEKAMEGVHTSSVLISTLDEAPMAYKAANEIVEQIAPTAEIIDRLMPVYNFKDKGQRFRRR